MLKLDAFALRNSAWRMALCGLSMIAAQSFAAARLAYTLKLDAFALRMLLELCNSFPENHRERMHGRVSRNV